MFKIEFEISQETATLLSKLPKRFEDGAVKALIDAMLFAEGEAKKIFKAGGPVLPAPGPLVARTGHLRRSIMSGVTGKTGWVGTDVFYGKIHELIGAGKKKVLRPFISPSFEGKNLDRIQDILVEGIMEEMTKK